MIMKFLRKDEEMRKQGMPLAFCSELVDNLERVIFSWGSNQCMVNSEDEYKEFIKEHGIERFYTDRIASHDFSKAPYIFSMLRLIPRGANTPINVIHDGKAYIQSDEGSTVETIHVQ